MRKNFWAVSSISLCFSLSAHAQSEVKRAEPIVISPQPTPVPKGSPGPLFRQVPTFDDFSSPEGFRKALENFRVDVEDRRSKNLPKDKYKDLIKMYRDGIKFYKKSQ